MAITIGAKREFEFTANDNNADPCLFPRDTSNSTFVQAFNFTTKNISTVASSNYFAFPFVIKLGSSLVGIYSDGDAHASSDRQIMIRSDNNGLTWTSATFYTNTTGAFDFSLLVGLLTPGQTATFKVWTVSNTAGTFSAVANSSVAFGGSNYAMWSKTVPGPGGVLYRTGYAAVGSDVQTALFQSANGGVTWTGVSVMFATVGRTYSEADIVNTSGTNWLAVVREDNGSLNNLYQATSTNNGTTWSAPTLIATTVINGRQPNLTKLSDNSLILAVGDRAGTTGYSGNGIQVTGVDTTGISIVRSTDAGATWSFRTRLSPLYSTDGGQPFVNETTAGRINVVFYARRSATTNPIITSASLDVVNL